MNIVCFGQQNWDVNWTAKQHLLTRLARRGHRVLYVDPIADSTHTKVGAKLRALSPARSGLGVRKVENGLHVFTPPVAHLLPAGIRKRLARRVVGRVAAKLGLWAPVAVCCWPAQRWLMDGVKPSAKLYLAFDENASFAGLPPAFAEHQRREEHKLMRECDVALAVSPALLERFSEIQPRSYLQENGVEADDFSPQSLAAAVPHPAIAALARPRIGFVGLIDDRMDQDLVVSLARRFRDASIVLAGPLKDGIDFARLRAEQNIHCVGPVDYAQLASVYREFDVGLVPYVSSPLTRACNPLKVYEYLAAGLPVVSTDLPGLNSTRELIAIVSSHEQFAEKVAAAVQEPTERTAQRRLSTEAFSWQRRADQLEERLVEAQAVAAERRQRTGQPDPRPDRHGRRAVRVEPRLDGKDASVRLLHDDYVDNRLSPQQRALYVLSRLVGLAYYGARRLARFLKGDRSAVCRILVVRNGHLGDTVVFLPTLAALRARYPRAKITVALAPGSGARQLLEASPHVDEVLALDFFNRSRRDRFRGVLKLLARGFDLVVGGVWYFHLPEAVFSGAPRRLGLYDGHPLQRYADRVVMLDPTLHEAQNNLRLVELVTGPIAPELQVPRLHLDNASLAAKAAQVRLRLGIEPATPVVAMHPGSKRPSRRWPARRFAELAAALLSERADLHVVLTGVGREEQELITDVRAAVPPELRARTHDAVGASDLLGVIGFYDTCKALVCNDTGVMHVARARGVPLVAIIGPENDRRWGPHPLGPAPAVAVRQQVPGTPHGKWECEWNLSLVSIDANRVKQHVDALLDGTFEHLHAVTPVVRGALRFYPLVRDVRRLSFAQLDELGLRLPQVAALLPDDPKLLGGDGQRASAEAVVSAARALRRQAYPRLDVVIVTNRPEQLAGADVGRASIIGVPADDPDAAWSAALAHTNARLVWPAAPGAALSASASAVSSRVAVFLRGPHADVVDGQRAWPIQRLVHVDLLNGQLLLTRSCLEDMLVHPSPPPHIADSEADASYPLEPALA